MHFFTLPKLFLRYCKKTVNDIDNISKTVNNIYEISKWVAMK